MVLGSISQDRLCKNTNPFAQMIEVILLLFLNPSLDLVQRIMIACYIAIGSRRHWTASATKYTMILFELTHHRNWYLAAHVFLLEMLEDCKLFVHRGKAEKVFWSFILADGLVAGVNTVFWNVFCKFIVGYLVASNVFFGHKAVQAILQNLIFVCFNLYLLIVHWHYVLFLLKYKLLMIGLISVMIVVGVASVNKAKRHQTIRLTITRKYFHLLALMLFLPIIILEVA